MNTPNIQIIFINLGLVMPSPATYEINPAFNIKNGQFDPLRVGYLNSAFAARTTKGVLLRDGWFRDERDKSVEEIQAMLVKCGFKGEIISKVPKLMDDNPYMVIGNEVRAWLLDNARLVGSTDFKQYSILDIRTHSEYLGSQMEHVIWVDFWMGLSPYNAMDADSLARSTFRTY